MSSLRNALFVAGALAFPALAGDPAAIKDEKALLERLHHANQMEISLGKLAAEKASSREVKDYGQMLVTEHTQADETLLAYAKANKLKLGEPKPSSEAEKKAMEASKADEAKLKAIEGPLFDSCFMSGMVSAHDGALLKVQAGVVAFPNAASLLQPLLPKLSAHRDQAYKILGTLKPGAGGVGGSGEGQEMKHP